MEREFEIGDRVKCWVWEFYLRRGRWVSGTVVRFRPWPITQLKFLFEACGSRKSGLRVLREDDRYITYEHPRLVLMDVLTDERVGDEPDDFFGGFGITGPPWGPDTIFEDEPAPPDGPKWDFKHEPDADLFDDDLPF